MVAPLVGFCGSRSLSDPASKRLVSRVVSSVLASGRSVAVGCALGADALVRASAPSASVFRASSFGGGSRRSPLARRSATLVSTVSSSGPGAGFVGFVSSPCPADLAPSPSSSRCFRGLGSGSWASLALAAGLGLPVVVFPAGLSPAYLPASWGSWAPLSGTWSSGYRLVPVLPPQATLFS